jgi:hypothetical protein
LLCGCIVYGNKPDPKTVLEALSGEDNRIVNISNGRIQNSLLENGIWKLHSDKNVLKNKWVLKMKKNVNGIGSWYKFWLVS